MWVLGIQLRSSNRCSNLWAVSPASVCKLILRTLSPERGKITGRPKHTVQEVSMNRLIEYWCIGGLKRVGEAGGCPPSPTSSLASYRTIGKDPPTTTFIINKGIQVASLQSLNPTVHHNSSWVNPGAKRIKAIQESIQLALCLEDSWGGGLTFQMVAFLRLFPSFWAEWSLFLLLGKQQVLPTESGRAERKQKADITWY